MMDLRAWYDLYLGGIYSLELIGIWCEFLEHIGSWTAAKKVHVVQLGDMYDFWIGIKRLFQDTEKVDGRPVILSPDSHGRVDYAKEQIKWMTNKTHETNKAVIKAFNDVDRRTMGVTYIGGNHDNYFVSNECPSIPGVDKRFNSINMMICILNMVTKATSPTEMGRHPVIVLQSWSLATLISEHSIRIAGGNGH